MKVDESTLGYTPASEENPQGEGSDTSVRKNSKWRKVFRWVLGVVITIVALLCIATALLYYPPIQKRILNEVAASMENATGLSITIDKVRIGFPVKLKLGGVVGRTEAGDTAVMVGELTAHLGVTPLIRGERVPISMFTLSDTFLDYRTPGDSLSLQGNIDHLNISRVEYGLKDDHLRIGRLALSDVTMDVIALSGEDKPDTIPSEPSKLVIEADEIKIDHVKWSFSSSYDSILVGGYVDHAALSQGLVDLPRAYYGAEGIDISGDMAAVGTTIDFLPLPWKFKIKGREAYYGGPNDIKAHVDHIQYQAGDGWRVTDGRLSCRKDSLRMKVWDINLKLPTSQMYGSIDLPFKGWTPDSIGVADVDLEGKVLLPELSRFVGDIPGAPSVPLDMNVQLHGEMDGRVKFLVDLYADNTIDLYMNGTADRFFDSKKKNVQALFSVKTGENTMQSVTEFISKGQAAKAPSWQLPAGISLSGEAKVTSGNVTADVDLKTREGHLNGMMQYAGGSQTYDAHVSITEFNLQQFLPNDTIHDVSGIIQAKGRGTDFFSPKTSFSFFTKIDSLKYNTVCLREITLLSELKHNQLFAAVNSENEALKLTAQLDATLKKHDVAGSVNLFVDSIIPSQLGLDVPVVQGGRLELRSSVRSDLDQYYDFKGEVENFFIQTDKGLLNPTNTYISAVTNDSSMIASASSGDLALNFSARNGLKDFTSRVQKVVETVQISMRDTVTKLDMRPWMEHYPNMDLKFSMGRNNLLRTYLAQSRIGAQKAELELSSRTNEGLRGEGYISDFQQDTFKINNMDLILRQDSSFFYATATAHKERFRNQLPFDVLASVTSNVHRSEVFFNWMDHNQADFVKFGLELWSRSNGDLELGFTPDPIVLAYNKFEQDGEQQYIRFPYRNRDKIEADLKLVSRQGMMIGVHNIPDPDGHLIHVDIRRLKLNTLKSLNLLPPVSGILDADLEWLQKKDKVNEYQLKVGIQNFKYDDKMVGTLLADATARQWKGNTYAKANLKLDDQDVVYAEYLQRKTQPKKPSLHLQINELPLERVNPFLPEKMAQLKGTFDAVLSNYNVDQNIETAAVGDYRGQVQMSGAELFVPRVNETYVLDNKPIVINDGYAILKDYGLIANDARLIANGSMKLTPDLPLDFAIRGNDIMLLNSDQAPDALFYGRVNADADLRIKGPAKAFHVTGDVSLLGSTDLTYQSQKSDIETKNYYQGLVEFTDFTDTLFVHREEAVDSLSLGGLDIDLGVHIAPAAQVTAFLSKNGGNKISIQGGGDFNLRMPPYGTMQLSGAYRINNGQVNLTFGPIGRKFDIRQGSQLSWSGDVMKPAIDFRATSRVSTRVSLQNEVSRQVNFDVSIIAENTLDDLKLRFITEAPEDLSMTNRLKALSDDEQTRQSLLLLGRGYFMGNQQSQNKSSTALINEALISLLASQVNSLAGEALDAEINFGVSDGTTTKGQGTNYSYSISKRFWNNRINFIVGGKVVTGEAAEGLQQTIIDNMSIEYQIDESGTRFLRLFHKKNYENLLDGEVTETGGGYLIRRRLRKLSDLFRFGNRARTRNHLPDSVPVPDLGVQEQVLVPPKSPMVKEETEVSHDK